MKSHSSRILFAWAATLSGLLASSCWAGTIVRFDTVLGSFDIQLYDEVMPSTVTNFLGYVNDSRYDGSVIHRNSDTLGRDFVIQGGGYFLHDPDPPNPASTITFSNVVNAGDVPINDEPGNGIAGPSNQRGTIAMAKSGPNTVTSQWFINQGDNSFLDDPNRGDGGFSAFGSVLNDGMDVVDAIGDLPLPNDFGFGISSPFNDLPLRNFSGNAINDIRVEHTVTVNSISVLPFTPGDFNLDNVVDQVDLAIWSEHYGLASGAFFDQGDADMDGDVDGSDFLLWNENVGLISAVTADVPEPGTMALVGSALVSLLATRRRQGSTSRLAS